MSRRFCGRSLSLPATPRAPTFAAPAVSFRCSCSVPAPSPRTSSLSWLPTSPPWPESSISPSWPREHSSTLPFGRRSWPWRTRSGRKWRSCRPPSPTSRMSPWSPFFACGAGLCGSRLRRSRLAAAVLRDALGVCVLTVLVTDAGLVAVARAATVVPALTVVPAADVAGTDLDLPARACAGGVAAFGVPFFATPARSAMASPNNKTGARQVAAHSRGWQEYGTYRRPTNTPHDLTRIRAQCVRCSHHLPGQTRCEIVKWSAIEAQMLNKPEITRSTSAQRFQDDQ